MARRPPGNKKKQHLQQHQQNQQQDQHDLDPNAWLLASHTGPESDSTSGTADPLQAQRPPSDGFSWDAFGDPAAVAAMPYQDDFFALPDMALASSSSPQAQVKQEPLAASSSASYTSPQYMPIPPMAQTASQSQSPPAATPLPLTASGTPLTDDMRKHRNRIYAKRSRDLKNNKYKEVVSCNEQLQREIEELRQENETLARVNEELERDAQELGLGKRS